MQLFRPGKEMKVRKTKHKAKSGTKAKCPIGPTLCMTVWCTDVKRCGVQ